MSFKFSFNLDRAPLFFELMLRLINSAFLSVWHPDEEAIFTFFEPLITFLLFSFSFVWNLQNLFSFCACFDNCTSFNRISIFLSFELTFCCVFEKFLLVLTGWSWLFVRFTFLSFSGNVDLFWTMFILPIFLEIFPYIPEVMLFVLTALAKKCLMLNCYLVVSVIWSLYIRGLYFNLILLSIEY